MKKIQIFAMSMILGLGLNACDPFYTFEFIEGVETKDGVLLCLGGIITDDGSLKSDYKIIDEKLQNAVQLNDLGSTTEVLIRGSIFGEWMLEHLDHKVSFDGGFTYRSATLSFQKIGEDDWFTTDGYIKISHSPGNPLLIIERINNEIADNVFAAREYKIYVAARHRYPEKGILKKFWACGFKVEFGQITP